MGIDDPIEPGADLTDDEALALAIQRDAELEFGAVKPLSHEELMKHLRR